MKYGLARLIDVYSTETQKGEQVLSTGGDYLQSNLWCGKHLQSLNEDIREVYQTYVWAYFALKRLGKLADYGLSDELSQATIEDMANKTTIYLNTIEDDSLPLAGAKRQEK